MRLGEQENEVSLATLVVNLMNSWLCPAHFQESQPEIENQRETKAAPGTVQQLLRVGRIGVVCQFLFYLFTCFNYVPLHGKQTSKQ